MKDRKGRAKPNLTKMLRIGTVVSLLLILAIISVYFVIRSRKQLKFPTKLKEITQQKIEKKEQVVHYEFKGERGNFLIKANKHYVGEDKKYHLEGKVEIIDFGKDEDQNVFIYGEEVVYDKNMNHFVLTGQSTIKYKDLIIKSNFLDYDKKKEVFKSNTGVRFSSQRLSGFAQKMTYSTNQEYLRLRENIHLEIIPKMENTLPLFVEGKKLDYNRKKKLGEVSGDVNLSQGKNQASAHTLKFILYQNEQSIKSISLKGKVKASLIEEDGEKKEERKRIIEADELYLDGFKKFSRVSSISAKGNCFYKFFVPSGGFIQIQGESLNFIFNPQGELKKFDALKKVRMIEYMENSEQKRLLEGVEMSFLGKTDILQIKGKDNVKARVLSQDSEIVAEEITINLEDDDLEAKNGVKVVFKDREDKKSIGFFSREQPVFITTQEMSYHKDKKSFKFNKDIKVWQEKKMLLTNELSFLEETGKLICSGEVKSLFFQKLKGKKEEERIEISADKMSFNPKKNVITYEENCSLKVRNIDLQAQSISVHLKEEKGGMETIIGQGGVKIVQEILEGKGEKARYDLEKEAITITGDPVVIDKNRGVTRGDKLTFYMGDGKIIVENKRRERSVTVIKS